jgi:hypothetical protein
MTGGYGGQDVFFDAAEGVTRPAAVRSLAAQREPPAPINPDY